MDFPTLYNIVKDVLSGERAKRTIKILSNFHRIQGSNGFLEAVDIIKHSILELDGHCEVLSYEADELDFGTARTTMIFFPCRNR